VKLDHIDNIAIIGTGMIGASMAVLFSANRYRTKMLAVNEAEAASGLARYEQNFRELVSKEIVTGKQASACRKYLEVTQSYADISDADVILECVVEKLDVKYSVYEQIEANCSGYKVIGSSTSAISPDDLCKGLRAKEKLAVTHPYNPPHLVPCIEIVGSEQTDEQVITLLNDLFRSVGRAPVVMSKSAPGFVANRLQHALCREAIYMVEQGIATPEAIDKALMTSFAPRYTSVGIFEHFDYAGLDMMRSVQEYLFPSLCNADKAQDLLLDRCNSGDLGVKTGKGVYDWSKKDFDDFRRRSVEPYLKFFYCDIPDE